MSALSSLVTEVTIQTTVTPDIVVNDPFGVGAGSPTSSGIGSLLLNIIRPKITVQTPLGPQTTAPWGDPGATAWPLLVVAVGIIVGIWLWR